MDVFFFWFFPFLYAFELCQQHIQLSMTPSKSAKKALTAQKAGSARAKASPYNKSAAGGAKLSGTGVSAKKTPYQPSKPAQARNKHKNVNLTSELDSLLGDLNNQLQRKKTKKDARLGVSGSLLICYM